MAVTEFYESRKMHLTAEGTTVMRVFTCTATDWNAGGDAGTTLPIVGDPWDVDIIRYDLRVTDINVYWLDNTNCRIEILYSTAGLSHSTHVPDAVSSKVEEFAMSTQPEVITDKYTDFTTGDRPSWGLAWEAASAGRKAADAPPITVHKANMTYSYKCNVSSWSYDTIRDAVGRINDSDMLVQWKSRVPGSLNRDAIYDATGDDTGKWLFHDFSARAVGDKNWELSLTFLYNDFGWNSPESVPINLYGTFDPFDLPWPTDLYDRQDEGLR
jgi:hypothetical protein